MAVGNAVVFGARFATRTEADVVRSRIETMGYSPREVSYIADVASCSSTFDEPGSHWNQMFLGGLLTGGTFAGVAGAVAGFGSIALLGPVAALVGASAGGALGVLYGLGLNSDKALACETAIKSGELVMIIQAHAGDATRVRELLGGHIIAEENDRYFDATPINEFPNVKKRT